MFEFAAWAPATVPLLAFGLDVVFGEPPVRLHPVVWMGHYLKWARKGWKAETPTSQLLEGAAGWALGAGLAAGAGYAASRAPWYVQGVLLKPLLARRALFAASLRFTKRKSPRIAAISAMTRPASRPARRRATRPGRRARGPG